MEEFVTSNLMEYVIEFADSPHFISTVENFVMRIVDDFEDTCDSKRAEENELPLTYHEHFLEYQGLLDRLFSEFADKHGVKSARSIHVLSKFRYDIMMPYHSFSVKALLGW